MVDSTTDVRVQVHAALGNQDSLKRTLRRQRAKHLPVNPVTTRELVINGGWVTTDGEKVNIYDNGIHSTECLFMQPMVAFII